MGGREVNLNLDNVLFVFLETTPNLLVLVLLYDILGVGGMQWYCYRIHRLKKSYGKVSEISGGGSSFVGGWGIDHLQYI